MTKLKFAAIVRVSTEGQKQKGESIKTQTTRLKQAAGLRGDEIVIWYAGNEHATPDHERKLLDQMLEDSGKGTFDAVIVDDPSRWSRDNSRSKTDLKILRANGIRFFASGMEYDLFNPMSMQMLNMQTEMNEHQAKIQAYKSITNKIGRAKGGIPTSGRLPYGRTFDRVNMKWGIDKEKHKLIKIVAEEYCKGTSIRHLANRFGVNSSSLHKTLLYRCGDTWIETFDSDEFNIHAEVTHKVPRLLSERIIRKCKEATQAKKTYNHRDKFRKYLLSRMIFCKDCGLACFGGENHGQLFYRHSRSRKKEEQHFGFISAKRIENAVLKDIFEWFGGANILDKQTIKKKADHLNHERKKVEASIQLYERELKSISTKKDNIIKAIEDGFYSPKLKNQNAKLEEREAAIQTEIDRLREQRDGFMTEVELQEQVKKAGSIRARLMRESLDEQLQHSREQYLKSEHYLEKMTFDQKKELVKIVFGGLDADGKRLGVYLSYSKDKWTYEIRGIFKSTITNILTEAKTAKKQRMFCI